MGNTFNTSIRIWVVKVVSTEPELFIMAQRADWSALIARAATHPHEAFWIDRCGNTALHLACRKQPPTEVIFALLRACQRTNSMQTINGMTPLHFACYCGASSDVVQVLIEANRDVVSTEDQRGRTPLHCACTGIKTPDINTVVRELLQVNPDLCYAVDTSGRSPLFLILDDYADAIEEQIHIVTSDNSSENLSINNEANKITEEHLLDLDGRWTSVTLLLKAAYHETMNGSKAISVPFRLLHACVGTRSCPVRFVFLALNLWPEQLKEVDSDGNLPLHIAAFSVSKRKHFRFNTLIKVLSMYPQAAQIPNKNGVLPLQLAIQSGKTWNEGIRELFEAYPEALTTLKIDFRYYPEILALAGEYFSLKTLYQVIVSKPEVLSYGL